MANFVAEGKVIDYTPDADVTAGDILTIGNIVAVAKHDIDSGDLGSVAVEGIYSLADADLDGAASDYSQGDPVFLDTGEYFGLAIEDGEATTSGEVRTLLIQNTQSDT